MRTSIKTAALVMLLLGAMVSVKAQSTTITSAWSTSKDVQKIANKKMFEDDGLRASHIQASIQTPTWMISKGIHRINAKDQMASGNIKSTGIPMWTVSKGVQRIGRK